MGLESQDKQKKSELRVLAGRHDWQAAVKTPDDAKQLIQKLKSYAINSNGQYMIDANMSLKIKLLERYIQSGSGVTLKEYVKKS